MCVRSALTSRGRPALFSQLPNPPAFEEHEYHEIAERLTWRFTLESCDNGVVPDAARELLRQ